MTFYKILRSEKNSNIYEKTQVESEKTKVSAVFGKIYLISNEKTEVKWKDLRKGDQEHMKKARGNEIGQWLEEKVCRILSAKESAEYR